MSILFKCKMCGGTIEFEEGATVGVCEYCGTKQTLPRLDDDRRANLYDRANHFRRNNEFDKAAGIYEQILSEDASDAEAYWSLVLCRYGIEYVEDPTTHKRVPTINRTQYTSIFDDDNYKSALEHADGAQRAIYEEEANAINEIQKGILAISQQEEPFDVFLCYKETDDSGRRTPDSVLANDIYHQLTQEGFKVFFSRITLEDKLGTAYEPYIFAALNSAKVMVVIGTKPEYFNAVWVKNEWSRYLSIVKQSGGKKVLIPAYRDMDPYDLPEEFSHLQAQDMSKLGFIQDLIRGIKKIVKTDESKAAVKETVTINSGNANVDALLQRAFLALEDSEWTVADEFCEQVLNLDAANAQAYLGKLMAELRVGQQEDLKNQEQSFEKNRNYQRAIRFGDPELENTLYGYIKYINDRNEELRKLSLYEEARSAMESADTEEAFLEAAELFRKISGFKDANLLVEKCIERGEAARKDAIYESAKAKMDGTIAGYESAIEEFQTIADWKDAEQMISSCRQGIEEIRNEEEREKEARQVAIREWEKARKRYIKIVAIIAVACIVLGLFYKNVLRPRQDYKYAMEHYHYGEYYEAYKLLDDLNYKDSEEKANDCKSKMITNAEVYKPVIIGKYEQDNDTSNGEESIEWIVLDKKDDRILLMSLYGLDRKTYNRVDKPVSWKNCSLREWLNKDFFNEAFTKDEQSRIIQTTVKNEDEEDTKDKVFLLSAPETEQYLGDVTIDFGVFSGWDGNPLTCGPTEYVRSYYGYEYSAGIWWLRACAIDGYCEIYDETVSEEALVRPVIWVSIGKE